MPIGLGPYPSTLLSDAQWEALYQANHDLIDDVLDDLGRLAGRAPFADLAIAASLPPKHLPRYDAAFLRKYLVCLVTIGAKLRLHGFHPLGCTGEALALLATKRRAAALLAARGEAV